MGLFSKSKKVKEEKKASKENWTGLTDVSQLDDAIEISKTKKVVLFKHSTRCSISASVLRKFDNQVGEETQVFLLDLIAHRDISAAIADKFKVVHQSPQAIFLENGKVTQHDSHYGILELNF